jgi:hypothetical protein
MRTAVPIKIILCQTALLKTAPNNYSANLHKVPHKGKKETGDNTSKGSLKYTIITTKLFPAEAC